MNFTIEQLRSLLTPEQIKALTNDSVTATLASINDHKTVKFTEGSYREELKITKKYCEELKKLHKVFIDNPDTQFYCIIQTLHGMGYIIKYEKYLGNCILPCQVFTEDNVPFDVEKLNRYEEIQLGKNFPKWFQNIPKMETPKPPPSEIVSPIFTGNVSIFSSDMTLDDLKKSPYDYEIYPNVKTYAMNTIEGFLRKKAKMEIFNLGNECEVQRQDRK